MTSKAEILHWSTKKELNGGKNVFVCVSVRVCVSASLPCGVIVCTGLPWPLTFHMVRVPSE